MVDLLELDEEWVALIIEAKNIGLQFEEVRDFLANEIEVKMVGTD